MRGHDRNDTKGVETEDLKCMCHFSYSELLYYNVIIIIVFGLAVEYGKPHISLASYNIAFLNSLLRGSRSHLDPTFGLKSEFIN